MEGTRHRPYKYSTRKFLGISGVSTTLCLDPSGQVGARVRASPATPYQSGGWGGDTASYRVRYPAYEMIIPCTAERFSKIAYRTTRI